MLIVPICPMEIWVRGGRGEKRYISGIEAHRSCSLKAGR